MTLVQHRSETNEHGTPPWLIEACRGIMGSIDVDPCSTPTFNQVVRASLFYTEADNGLDQPWAGNVFCNPPGGKVKRVDSTFKGTNPKTPNWHSSQALWFAHLWKRWTSGEIDQAMFLSFNPEVMRHACNYLPVGHPLEYPLVIFKERLCFLDESLEPQEDPGHWNFLVWMPGPDEKQRLPIFREVFQEYGFVHAPAQYIQSRTYR